MANCGGIMRGKYAGVYFSTKTNMNVIFRGGVKIEELPSVSTEMHVNAVD